MRALLARRSQKTVHKLHNGIWSRKVLSCMLNFMTSRNNRLTRLLDRGFYPVELPPPFRTVGFSSIHSSLVPPPRYHGSTTFYDGATFRGPLRTFGVINPVNFLLLSQFIADRWTEIVDIYKLSRCSGSRPKFPKLSSPGRAIETASLASKRKSQRHLASSFPVILSLDINRFYGSIYTHSIPWAVLGKDQAKLMLRSGNLSGHWSDTLDMLVRNCNQGQTIGLAIGPDTSRILSEIILSRIDAELTATGSGLSSQQIYHNIDDYQFGCLGVGNAEDTQSRFVRTVSRYELRLNDFKTSVDHGISFSPSNFQRHFDVLSDQSGANFVEHFFEILYTQIPLHPNTNVVGYALKRFARKLSRNSERDLVREYLQRLIFAAPHQARWILPLLLGVYSVLGVNSEVRRLIAWGIETCARRNDVGSLLWYLYAAIYLRVRVTTALCTQCFGMSNELVDLVLCHGRDAGLFSFEERDLRVRYAGSDFASPAWLPLYEIGRRGWDTTQAFNKIGTGDDPNGLYAHLRDQGVEFYDTRQARFEVTAFDGWNLTQDDFEGGEDPVLPVPFGLPGWGDWEDDWENYT